MVAAMLVGVLVVFDEVVGGFVSAVLATVRLDFVNHLEAKSY